MSNAGSSGGGHKSKGHSLAILALTLLTFLYFINMLQSGLKQHMTSMNPTVMVMMSGQKVESPIRFRKTQIPAITINTNKELNRNDHNENEAMISSVSDNIDVMTNNQGDVFFGPAPKISFKLENPFEAKSADIQEEKKKNKNFKLIKINC